jgi:hypothetical protein
MKDQNWHPLMGRLIEADGYSNKMNAATKHVSDSTTQVGQDHIATRVLMVLGTNTQTFETKHTKRTIETYTACCLCYTGQTDGRCQSDRWIGPVGPVATAVAQQTFQEASETSLGPGTKTTSKTQPTRKENPSQSLAKQLQTSQERTSSTTGQNHTK